MIRLGDLYLDQWEEALAYGHGVSMRKTKSGGIESSREDMFPTR